MTPPELCRAPATELSAAIRAKQLSPVEIVEAVLARIESVNPAINAYLDVDGDRALDAARAAEDSRHARRRTRPPARPARLHQRP